MSNRFDVAGLRRSIVIVPETEGTRHHPQDCPPATALFEERASGQPRYRHAFRPLVGRHRTTTLANTSAKCGE